MVLSRHSHFVGREHPQWHHMSAIGCKADIARNQNDVHRAAANLCDPLHSLGRNRRCKLQLRDRGTNVMNEMTFDQNNEELVAYEVSDEALEAAATTEREKANTFTQWICTALYFNIGGCSANVCFDPKRTSNRSLTRFIWTASVAFAAISSH